MIKQHIKQAWQLIKQNKLYSSVYIIGTGLAISMTMVLAIVYYIKLAPVYPENNRNRTLVVKHLMLTYPDVQWRSTSNLSYPFVKNYFYTLETPEAVTAVINIWQDNSTLILSDGKSTMSPKVRYVDNNFWKVFTFHFVNGKPFTEADFGSAIKTAVISESVANKLFGNISAEGLYITLNNNQYRITGVVKDPSFATPATYGDIWIPYSVKPEELKPINVGEGFLGRMNVYMLSPSVSEMAKIKKEVKEVYDKINNSQDSYTLHLNDQPDPYWKSVFRIYSGRDIDWMETGKTVGILFLAMLFIPAFNLAGMVSSRMEKRLPEMGIRKTFGASRRTLYVQILMENLLLTLLGGVVGLFFSCIIIYMGKNSILTLLDKWPETLPENIESFFTMDMLINPTVFFITFLICIILNFVSAIIPARQGLRKNIIYSLNKENV